MTTTARIARITHCLRELRAAQGSPIKQLGVLRDHGSTLLIALAERELRMLLIEQGDKPSPLEEAVERAQEQEKKP